jgi:hypothetical protein
MQTTNFKVLLNSILTLIVARINAKEYIYSNKNSEIFRGSITPPFSTPAIDGGEKSVSDHGRFTPGGESNLLIIGWEDGRMRGPQRRSGQGEVKNAFPHAPSKRTCFCLLINILKLCILPTLFSYVSHIFLTIKGNF